MSHSRASDILRRTLACWGGGGGGLEDDRLLWRHALESPDDVVPVASLFGMLFLRRDYLILVKEVQLGATLDVSGMRCRNEKQNTTS